MPNKGTVVLLTDKEREMIRAIAELEGISEEDAASQLVSKAMARRLKRNTGKSPAKVYPIRKH